MLENASEIWGNDDMERVATMHTENFTILRRWFSGLPPITVEITCKIDASTRVKMGLAVKVAFAQGVDLRGAILSHADLLDAILRGAILRDADLRGADLRGVDLRDADLRDADLRGVDLRGAILSHADLFDAILRGASLSHAILRGAPKIENIHTKVYESASQPGALKMKTWHCGTAHCRGGWVCELAGSAGKKLEGEIGTAAAAALIYLASDPKLDRIPNFYTTNKAALADMKRLAEAEAAR